VKPSSESVPGGPSENKGPEEALLRWCEVQVEGSESLAAPSLLPVEGTAQPPGTWLDSRGTLALIRPLPPAVPPEEKHWQQPSAGII
jgi:hypothetical protein